MAKKKGVSIKAEGGGRIYASDIIEQIAKINESENRLKADGKSAAAALIMKAKRTFLDIFDIVAYDRIDKEPEKGKKDIEALSNWGIKWLETLDGVIAAEGFGGNEAVTQCKEDTTEWKYISDGILPERNEDILFSLKCGQVFEGFFETKDHTSAYLTEDGKIGFKPYEDGGKFFRYRFRDFIDMKSVVAWAYKPAAAKYERKENAK